MPWRLTPIPNPPPTPQPPAPPGGKITFVAWPRVWKVAWPGAIPLPTPFRALTGAPSPIRPPKGGSLGDKFFGHGRAWPVMTLLRIIACRGATPRAPSAAVCVMRFFKKPHAPALWRVFRLSDGSVRVFNSLFYSQYFPEFSVIDV